MLQSVIMGIVEPTGYSLDNSVAWKLTAGLKAKAGYYLNNSAGVRVASLSGIVPIVQPIQAVIAGQSAFLMMMKGIFASTDEYGWPATEQLLLFDERQMKLAELFVSSHEPLKPVRSLLRSNEFQNLSADNHIALVRYVDALIRSFWGAEPINWTTDRLHLTSSAQLLTPGEIQKAGLVSGKVLIEQGSSALIEGVAVQAVSFKTWQKAGRINEFPVADDAAGSASTCGGPTTGSSGTYWSSTICFETCL